MESFIQAFKDDPVLLVIPFISAIVGWVTNIVAIKMMFHPLEFVGVRPIGWQGIVPANAIRLASKGLKLVTSQVLDIKELFEDFDADYFIKENEQKLDELTRSIVEEKAQQYAPAMWKSLSPQIKEQVFTMAKAEVTKLSTAVFNDLRDATPDIIDVEAIVMEAVAEDKELLNRLFLQVGVAEFKFIARSGLYFGFLFGLVQLVVWILYPAWFILPAFGFFVGYATNWLALKLVFEPKEPKQFGRIVIQGLFHRRQKEISLKFSQIVSKRVFSGENIFKEFSTDKARATLREIIDRHTETALGPFRNHPMAKGLLKPEQMDDLQADVMKQVDHELYREGGFIYEFGNKSEQIRTTLIERMSVMEPEGFENVLRPAFRQDEWKLILAGGILGLAAGIAQVVYIFGDMVLGS